MKSSLPILYLEDDPNDVELVQSILAEEGIACDVVQVETRADFLAALEQGGFDLILADYNLPSFDGLSALAIVQDKCPDVPFILVSGVLGEEVAIESLKSGATDYVFKRRILWENILLLPIFGTIDPKRAQEIMGRPCWPKYSGPKRKSHHSFMQFAMQIPLKRLRRNL